MYWFLLLAELVVPSWQMMGPQMGPIGRLDLKKWEECPKIKNIINIQLNHDKNGRQTMSGQLDLPFDFDKKVTFKVMIDKWTGSEWKKKVMTYDGSLCEYYNKNAPELRKRVYAKAGVSGDCVIKKGKYAVTDVHATEKDIKMSAVPYGTFRIELQLLDDKKKIHACYIIDLDSIPK